MYAIIRAGGKQHKVAEGDVIDVELIKSDSAKVEFTPLLVVDDKGATRATPGDLKGALVTASVVGQTAGPKIDVMKFRNKTGYRRHTGHRQKYTSIRVESIKIG